MGWGGHCARGGAVRPSRMVSGDEATPGICWRLGPCVMVRNIRKWTVHR
jgi:hypothetical protein